MTPRQILSHLAMIGALAVIYLAAAKLGLTLAVVNASTTAVWPPAGISLAALLVLGYRVWPGILIGALFANGTITGWTLTTFGIAAGNLLEGLAGAWLINRFARGRGAFDRAQDVLKFAILAGLVSPMVSATVGVASLALGGFANWADASAIWLTWWLGDATANIILAPVLILWAARPYLGWTRKLFFEAAFLIAFLVLLGPAVYGGLSPIGSKTYPLQFLIFPILIWSAFRFSQRETAAVALVISGIAIWGTLTNWSNLPKDSQNELLLALQSFMSVIAITGLTLAALVAEQKQTESKLRRAYDATTRQVEEQQVSLLGANEHLQLYADIIKNIPIGLSVIELENPADLKSLRILDVNPNTAKITGIKAETYIGRYLKDVSPQTFERGTDQLYAEVLRDNNPRDFGEVRNTNPKIPAEWFAAKIFPLPKNRIAVTLEDITARKQVQAAFDQQKQLYETLLKAQSDVGDGVAISEGAHMIYANQALERIYGYSKDEILAMPSLFDLVEPEERSRLIELQRQRLGGETTPGRGETVILRKNGERVPIEYVVQPIEVNGRWQSISISRDISERKHAEQALQASEEKFKGLLESAPDALVIVDRDSNVRIVNSETEKMFGYTREELLGKSVDLLLPEHLRAKHDAHRSGYFSQPQSRMMGAGLELSGRRKNGTEFPVDISLSPLETEEGILVTAAVRDITDRKNAEKSLQKSEARLRALATRLVDSQESERRRIARELHDEFGQVLTGLKMNLENVQNSTTGDLQNSVVEAKLISSELLEKVRSMSRDLRPSILDDLGLLAALISQFERYHAQTKIQVDFKQRGLGDRRFPPKVEINVYRIIQEALTNVARYAHVDLVSVRVRADQDAMSVEVEDKGTGFDPETVSPGVSGGLVGMSERIIAVGGQFRIKSAPSMGTRMIAQIPLHELR